MRFWTIWTLPGCTLREKLLRTREWMAMCVAKRLPVRIRYWVFIQQASKATACLNSEVMSTPLDKLLQNIDTPKSVA